MDPFYRLHCSYPQSSAHVTRTNRWDNIIVYFYLIFKNWCKNIIKDLKEICFYALSNIIKYVCLSFKKKRVSVTGDWYWYLFQMMVSRVAVLCCLFVVSMVMITTVSSSSLSIFMDNYKLCYDGFVGNDVDCYSCARKLHDLSVYSKCCSGEKQYMEFCNVYLQ